MVQSEEFFQATSFYSGESHISKTILTYILEKWMSYKDMSMHLYDEKELGNCIDFVAMAPVMLDIPIPMVQPTQHKVIETGPVYYEFHEIKMREEDEHLPANLHKIQLMFNGIDTFIPFMKIEIGNIVNRGVVAMRQVCDSYSSIKELVGHSQPNDYQRCGEQYTWPFAYCHKNSHNKIQLWHCRNESGNRCSTRYWYIWQSGHM